MDPLSAFSLACGVAQIISFAGELVSAGHEIYHSTDGVLLQNKQSEEIANDLRDLAHDVSRSSSKLLAGQRLSNDEWRLRVIADNCTAIATQLIERLEKLKVQGKHRRLKSYRLALMSVWQKKDLDDIAARLEKHQKELDTRILAGLRRQLHDIDVQNSDQFKVLDSRTKDLVLAVLDGGERVESHLSDQDKILAQLLSGQDRLLTIISDEKRSSSPAPPYDLVVTQRQSTELHEAARAGNVLRVRQLQRSEVIDINAKDGHGCTPLHFASTAEVAKRLLSDKRTNIQAEDDEGRTALHYAVLTRNPEVVKALIEDGVDQTLEDDRGRTAAFYANGFPVAAWMLKYGVANDVRAGTVGNNGLTRMAWLGDLEGVRFFLQQGADVNTQNLRRQTALTEAARHGDVDVVDLLLKHGASPEIAAHGEWTALLQAVRDDRIQVVRVLLQRGANAEARLKNGNNPLAEACKRGHFDIARLLLEAGSSLETKDSDGYTPLLQAARQGDVDFTRHLLKAGASKHEKSFDGFTALSAAAQKGHHECVELLLTHGADANVRGHSDYTPLAEASFHGHVKVVKLLLDHGAQLEVPQNEGYTPIGNAARNGRGDIIEVLAAAGANLEAAGFAHLSKDLKNTPLIQAASLGKTEAAVVLAGLGANLEAVDAYGRTALTHAVRNRHASCVEALIQKGADVNAQSQEGHGPLHEAAAIGSEEICNLLVDAGAHLWLRDDMERTPWIRAKLNAHDQALKHILEPPDEAREKLVKMCEEQHPSKIAAYLEGLYG